MFDYCVVQHVRLQTVGSVIPEIRASATSVMTTTFSLHIMSAKVLIFSMSFICLLITKRQILGLIFFKLAQFIMSGVFPRLISLM